MVDKYINMSIDDLWDVILQRKIREVLLGGRGICPLANMSITNLTWSAVITNPRLIGNNPALAVPLLNAVQW
jgi:hypothetical protein